MHDRQRQAGVDAPSVDQHRAGAALAVVAPFFEPVSCRCSRKASSSVVRVSSLSACALPLTLSVTRCVTTAGPWRRLRVRDQRRGRCGRSELQNVASGQFEVTGTLHGISR